MTAFPSTLRRLPAFRHLLAEQGGIAAVEFALILPILLTLWIGGVEVTSALSVDRRLNNLTSSLGDLVARSKMVTYADVDEIFDIAPGAMFPYDAAVSMRITAVKIDEDGEATVAWSRAEGVYPAHALDDEMNDFVPETLRVPDSQIIMSEVYRTYSPAIGYVVTGDLELEDRMFFVPRLVSAVKLCESSASDADCWS